MLDTYINKIINRPWYTFLLATIFVVIAAAGAMRLWFSADFEVYFDKDNPHLTAYHSLQHKFTKDDNVLFIVAPNDGNVFTKKQLALLQELTDKAWHLPYSSRVDSIVNYQHTHAEDDDLVIANLVKNSDQLTIDQINYVKDIALSEPVLVNRIVSPSGHVAGVNMTVRFGDAERQQAITEVSIAARNLAAELEQKVGDVKIYLTGGVIMDMTFAEATISDMSTLTPLMYLVILIMLALIIRSVKMIFIAMFVIVLATIATMGTAGWLGITLSPPTSTATTIILTLAVAGIVHILVTFLSSISSGDDNKYEAVRRSFKHNLKPIFICSITTAIGFLSFNFSESPPFRDLGNIVALGVLWIFLLLVTLLPAMLAIIPVNIKNKRKNAYVLVNFSSFVIKHKKLLLFLSPLIIGIPTSFIIKNTPNDEYVKYFDESVPFRIATEFAEKNLGGTYQIDYSLSSGVSGGISSPDYLNKIDAFAKWYRNNPEVKHVATVVDTIKRLNRDMHGGKEEWYSVPQDPQLTAQYLLLYEMSLPPGLDLKSQIDVDKSATRFTVTLANLSSQQLLDLESRAINWLEKNAPDITTAATGPAIMFAHIGMTNIRSMLLGTCLALLLISLTLIFAFRSVSMGIASLLPNFIPLLMSFGFWGLIDGQITLAIAVVSGMTLGIIVDDTVHFMSRYNNARAKFLDAEAAVKYAFENSGFALLVTTIILTFGFMVLSFSSYEVNSSMAMLTMLTLILAILVDFLILPALLLVFDKRKFTKNVFSVSESNEYINGVLNYEKNI